MNEHIYGKHNCIWQEKIEKNEQLYWWVRISLNGGFFAKEYPKHLLEITNVVRLLCGSYKVRGKRISNPVVYTDVCDVCGKRFVNPVNHALLHCSAHMMRGKICGIG